MAGEKLPLISVIIPSRDDSRRENIARLLDDIARQKIETSVEICQVQGIEPSGRARNVGAEKAKGDILVFIDDDIRLANEYTLSSLIKPLLDDKTIVATTSSVLIPPNSSAFERRYAKEIPRSEIPQVDKITESHAINTQLCLIRKDIFFKVGRFNEELKRGEDPELSYRLKKAGLRLVLSAGSLAYHPLPGNISELIRINFRNGHATCFADRNYPELNIDVNPEGIIYPTKIQTKFFRFKRFLSKLLNSIFSFKPLLLSAKISYACGYLYAYISK